MKAETCATRGCPYRPVDGRYFCATCLQGFADVTAPSGDPALLRRERDAALARLTTLESVLAAAVETQATCGERAKANRAAQKTAAEACGYEAAGVYRGRAEVYEEIHDALAAACGKAKGGVDG